MGKTRFFTGSYTRPEGHVPGGCGAGILSCLLDEKSGEMSIGTVRTGLLNPSWVLPSPDGRYLYALEENPDEPGSVVAFQIEEDGSLVETDRRRAAGRASCHLTCTADGRELFCASYLDGFLTWFRMEEGRFLSADSVSYRGNGPNRERQEGAHPHQAAVHPDGGFLAVCDLGSDRIRLHGLPFSRENPVRSAALPAGYGPRHLVFDPAGGLFHVLCELKPRLLTFRIPEEDGMMPRLLEDQPVLPAQYLYGSDGVVPSPAALRMHPSGKALYLSVRGCNRISVFCPDGEGIPRWKTDFPSLGVTPRDIAFSPSGRWLLAAGQDSDAIVPFSVDEVTGLPAGDPGPVLGCGSPSCIAFAAP